MNFSIFMIAIISLAAGAASSLNCNSLTRDELEGTLKVTSAFINSSGIEDLSIREFRTEVKNCLSSINENDVNHSELFLERKLDEARLIFEYNLIDSKEKERKLIDEYNELNKNL